ncbi:MAG: InlB B-repeat-containing protein, partial [Clostridia bacterium]|nr:InlB B-repeat-containing protein [Clostridia bacterium]
TAECENGCGETDTVADTGSALGHNFENYVSDENATCEADGTKTADCENGCGETDTVADTGSALGHNFENYVSDENATCEADGTKTADCENGCGETDTVADIGSALGHNFNGNTTCQNAGCDAEAPKAILSVNGKIISETVYSGGEMIAADDVDGYTFVGWATESLGQNETNLSPSLLEVGSTLEIESNTTYYAVYRKSVVIGSNYSLTSIDDIEQTDIVVITMTTSNGTVYALTSSNGSSDAPNAIIVAISDNVINSDITPDLKWNISSENGSFTIYPNGREDTWLYCTNSNNGVRVGTNDNKAFVLDTSGYLKNTATNRYVGVYTTNPDWRCYENTTGNIKDQTLRLFVYRETTEIRYVTCTHSETTSISTATCEASGKETVTCNNCNKVISSVDVDALGHSFTEIIQTTPADCTNDGLEVVGCERCDSTENRVLPAVGHTFVDGECSVCHEPDPNYQPGSGDDKTYGYKLVTDTSTLKAGSKIIIVSGEYVAGNISNSIMASVSIDYSEDIILTLPSGAIVLTLNGSEGSWTLTNESGQLLGATAVKKLAWGSGTSTWSISINSDSLATIQNGTASYGRFLYNTGSPRFTTYTSDTNASMLLPQIFVYTEIESGSSTPEHTCQNACPTCGMCTNAECTYDVCKNNQCEGHDVSISKATSISVNDVVYLVCEAKTMQLSGISTTSTKYGIGVAYTEALNPETYSLTVVQGSSAGTYAFKTNDGKYLSWSSENSLTTSTTIDANSSWTVEFVDGNAIIKNAKDNSRQLQWNASSPRFACYTSVQTAIQLYKKG